MGFLAKLGWVVEKPELKEGDADLSDDDMDKIIAEGTPGAKPPKVKPLTMSTAPAVDPVIGSLSPAPQQHPMDFPALYVQAKIPVPTHGFTVHKVGTMLQAGRLGKMAPQVRGAVVLATLETNGVPVADIFEDAELRETCLEGYQQFLERKLISGDEANRQEIVRLEAELAAVTEGVRAKIETLNRENHQRASLFQAWKDRKANELAVIHNTVKTLKDSDGVGDPMFNSNPFQK